jgi:hypothetical protein
VFFKETRCNNKGRDGLGINPDNPFLFRNLPPKKGVDNRRSLAVDSLWKTCVPLTVEKAPPTYPQDLPGQLVRVLNRF